MELLTRTLSPGPIRSRRGALALGLIVPIDALLQLEQRLRRRELEARVPRGVGVLEVAVRGVRDVDLLAAGGDVEPSFVR